MFLNTMIQHFINNPAGTAILLGKILEGEISKCRLFGTKAAVTAVKQLNFIKISLLRQIVKSEIQT